MSQSPLDPASGAAQDIALLWWVMLLGSLVVLAVVLVLVGVVLLRRRGRSLPPRRLIWLPIVGGIAVPTVVLVALFAFVLWTMTSVSADAAGSSEVTVRVTGRQWFWDIEYANGVRTANELHIPVGEPVRVEVASGDVIHSFWVPELNRKLDMIPGTRNTLVLRADRAGTYRGQCAEFCGLQHARMAFLVVAEPQARFRAWLAAQARPAGEPATVGLRQGQEVFLSSACVYCHRIAGTNATGKVGPDLTHLASRRTIGAALLPNTRGYLAGWVLDPQHFKPGNRMPGTDYPGDQLQLLLDYLESLE